MTHIVPASLSDLLFCFPVELWALKYMASTPSRRASYPLPVRQTCICYRLPLERLLPYAPCRVASSSPQRASRGTSTLQDMRPAGRTMKKPRSSYELLTTGGRGGIRTLDRARPYAAFPGRYIQPLCHPSRMGSTKAFKPVPNKGLRLQDNQRYRLARLEIIRMHITLSRHSHNIFF